GGWTVGCRSAMASAHSNARGGPMSSVDPILAAIRETTRLLGDGVIVTAADLAEPRIVHVNEALCRITGYRADELVGNTPRLLQGPKTNRGVLATLRSALEAHHQFFGEIVNYRKDGGDYPVELQIVPVNDAAGALRYRLAL